MEYLIQIGKKQRLPKRISVFWKLPERIRFFARLPLSPSAHAEEILRANEKDMEQGRKNGMSEGLLDRLLLTRERIAGIGEAVCQIADLEDPVGEVIGMKKRPNGLLIGQKRVPLGVVGIIYEARPNVTADAFGLCFKTGNVAILKGGSDAIHSNQAIVHCLRQR